MADNDSRLGARYSTPAILDWLAELHAPHDAAASAAFRADDLHGLPAIQVGPAEGKTLHLLLRMIRAKRVVEIGTLAGYSAIWMARALPADGELVSLELDEAHAAVARENLEAADLAANARVVVGDALESLSALDGQGPFCAVFIDADKGRYDQYAEWARRNLRTGGLLIGDNAFFFGDLLEPQNASAAAMRRFHEILQEHFESVCIPTPDGLAVGLLRESLT